MTMKLIKDDERGWTLELPTVARIPFSPNGKAIFEHSLWWWKGLNLLIKKQLVNWNTYWEEWGSP